MMRAFAASTIWLLWLSQVQARALPAAQDDDSFPLEGLFARSNTDDFEFLTSYASEDIIPTTATVSVSTSTAPTGTAILLPSLTGDIEPHTAGFVITTIDNPAQTELPLLTDPIPVPTSLLQPFTTGRAAKRADTADDSDIHKRQAAVSDIFSAAIDIRAPRGTITRRTDHPVPRKGITKNGPIQTNKFFSNFFLGDQTNPVYTFPYSLSWSAGKGPAASWGMAISHVDANQRFFGDVKFNNAVQYYTHPIGIQSIVISAKELGKNTVLTMDGLSSQFHANVQLRKDSNSQPAISFPVTQGMIFTTALFSGSTPIFQSGVYFRSVTRVAKDPKTNVRKFNIVLEDGTTWRLYAYRTQGDALDLKVVNNGLVQASKPFYGVIQVAKDPKVGKSERVLDNGCGVYSTGMTLSGSASGSQGTYTFTWARAGHTVGNLYIFALPHHVSSFDTTTRNRINDLQMQTTTKGIATAVVGMQWTMVESAMPVNMNFNPSHTTLGNRGLSTKAKNIIKPIAHLEVSQDMVNQTDLDSTYFSGKALAKFGSIVYVINNMIGDKALGQAGLAQLKKAFEKFTLNQQRQPLNYESAWGGIVSSATYKNNDPYYDFGNTYYNDHHFHFGYHILTAAYIGTMDSKWLTANTGWVNSLVRDFANPSTKDTYFPQWRHFDWYHGHSWAHGLFPAWDGKNQESSSEDIMAAYAVKMWGTVIKDANMVARANLQLAVMTRSMQQYYLYTADNTVQPKNFIGNKVAGILFENKIDHTTFFDSAIEAIQGIHMIPLLPPSNLARSAKFVQEEWDAFFSNGRVDQIDNGWKGIIYGNYATVNPKAAWDFFASDSFNETKWLDGGASRTWYLAYAAAMAGI